MFKKTAVRSRCELSAFLAFATALIIAGSASVPHNNRVSAQTPSSLAPFVPTPQDVVDRMLELAGVTGKDVVYDLGCGDGQIVITAAERYGARGVGVDIDPQRIAESKANAERASVTHLVRFVQQDAMDVDVSDAIVATLVPALFIQHETSANPVTSQLRPGARIVSHAFIMGNWEAK